MREGLLYGGLGRRWRSGMPQRAIDPEITLDGVKEAEERVKKA